MIDQFKLAELEKELENFIAEQKYDDVKELAKKYPYYYRYKIKPGAPYGVSCPGTEVEFYSYNRGGLMCVIVLPENRLPTANEHEKKIAFQHGLSHEKLKKIQSNPVMVQIDPIFLERLDELDKRY